MFSGFSSPEITAASRLEKMMKLISRPLLLALGLFVALAALPALGAEVVPQAAAVHPAAAAAQVPVSAPSAGVLALWSLPFVIILLSIALLPLIPAVAHWWDHNHNKLLVSGLLGVAVCAYYLLRPQGYEHAAPGSASLFTLLHSVLLGDYFPFIVLLLSLFTISGGIRLSGDIPAHPVTNTLTLFVGAVLASLIGTTGASMVLIRPLLQINSERKHVTHTVIFFIFMVSNIGGALLPVGDPPLFLGYLKGVPFLWTLRMWPIWLTCIGVLLAVYWVMESYAYSKEDKSSLVLDETKRIPITLRGKRNFLLLAGVVLAVGLLVPGRKVPGLPVVVPNYMREIMLLGFSAVSMVWTPKLIRKENHFNFTAIGEVACLFIGIFLTMQAPIELLHLTGASLPLHAPAHFFWASGSLSSFLDNAPTYVVFFETAKSLPIAPGVDVLHLLGGGQIPIRLLEAVSLGSVFMGANTYIGNGPNFLVKSIAEHHGVKMPSFFGYMVYSGLILIPLFIVITRLFFH
jgi:Na+/H+ antiporter NhaD/arsenite permease-like protein